MSLYLESDLALLLFAPFFSISNGNATFLLFLLFNLWIYCKQMWYYFFLHIQWWKMFIQQQKTFILLYCGDGRHIRNNLLHHLPPQISNIHNIIIFFFKNLAWSHASAFSSVTVYIFFYVKALYCIFLNSSSAHMMQEAGLGLLTFCILLEEFLFYLFIVVQLLLALSN